MTDNPRIDVKTRTIKGDFFIIPNGLNSLSGFFPSSRERMVRDLGRHVFTTASGQTVKGSEVSQTEPLIQIWWTVPDEGDAGGIDNLRCHPAEEAGVVLPFSAGRGSGFKGIVEYVPAHALAGVREGDSIRVEMEDGDGNVWTLDMTARQRQYRYARFGGFSGTKARLLWQYVEWMAKQDNDVTA